MSKPTEAQVRTLELAHKGQFVNLVVANRLWVNLLPRLKGKAKTSKEYVSLLAFGKVIANLAGKWYVRQRDLEVRGGIPSTPSNLVSLFLDPAKATALEAQAKTYLNPKTDSKLPTTIGIIPLIIWAVIAIVAAFTAYEIIDETNTTAEEKADLMKQTQKTLQDLNITGPEAAAIIANTQAQASDNSGGLSGSIMKIGLLALIVYFGMQQVNKNKS